MNPLQEKLNEIDKRFYNLTRPSGEWGLDTDKVRDFLNEELKSIINLTLEEAKKALPKEMVNRKNYLEADKAYVQAFNHSRQQTLEALDKMKL